MRVTSVSLIMTPNRLIIRHEQDQLQLSWERSKVLQGTAPIVEFQHPFSKEVLDRLRWYLEEYLDFPYGIFPEDAQRIEEQFKNWGAQLFETVFQGNEEVKAFWRAAVHDGLDQCELAISSDQSQVLSLPWELLYSPSDRVFLAEAMAGMYRSLNTPPVHSDIGDLHRDRLNILLVIARPGGTKDIGFQTIARPLLQALQPIQEQVFLKVLRPPTFEALEQELQHSKGFYHIVHFDGHGNYDPGLGQGLLVFETEEGTAQEILAERIAQSLTDCRVPVFVLNACQSGQEGEEKFSSVATQLVAGGAKGVVAMAYSVHAVAAREFIQQLYGELAYGSNLAKAVKAGRHRMLKQRLRSCVKGDLPLQDWMVPVLYQQESYVPFVSRSQQRSFADLMAQVSQQDPQSQESEGDPLPENLFGLVGRDVETLLLERGFRQSTVVLLSGVGGVGKTELACGFARWLVQTQGRDPHGIFFFSFEHGVGLSQVIGGIGRRIGGDQFDQLLLGQQRQAVIQFLREHQCLLIWDNFEPVNGFPTGNEPLLPDSEREDLKQFLQDLSEGQSWVLITSRRREDWLECSYQPLELRGLTQQDGQALARKILEQSGVEVSQLSSGYVGLLKYLGGHPLCLRVVLPHLKEESPEQVLEGLRRGKTELGGMEEESRDKSLTASLAYSFSQLSERARRHLPFLGLFVERVNLDWLETFSRAPEDENGETYQQVFGQTLDRTGWESVLEEGRETGILDKRRHDGAGIYQLHPALPWYLRQHLKEFGGTERMQQLGDRLLVFYTSLAKIYGQRLENLDDLAMRVLRIEEPNLLHQLRLAAHQGRWSKVLFLVLAIGGLYQQTNRRAEFRALREKALSQVGRDLRVAQEKGLYGFSLWMHLKEEEANEALQLARLDEAKEIHQEILSELEGWGDDTAASSIAHAYHQLGIVAEKQRQYEEAKRYFGKALEICEQTGDIHKTAGIYHHLGNVAEEQRQYKEAERYYRKALEIDEQLGSVYSSASTYHQLGTIAKEQRHYEEAEYYYCRALDIFQQVGDDYSSANTYRDLGSVAKEERRYGDAECYYRDALQIFEESGDIYSGAYIYQHLGGMAEENMQYGEAERYYRKAINTFEQLGDFYSSARTYHLLGRSVEEQKQYEEAEHYYCRALEIYEQVGDFYSNAPTFHHLGRVAQARRQYQKAEDCFHKAIEIFEQAGDIYSSGRTSLQLGSMAEEQNQYKEAEQYYHKALNIFDQFGDIHSIAYSYHNLGSVTHNQSQYEQAERYYHKALDKFNQVGDEYSSARTRHQLGLSAQEQGNLNEAFPYFVEAFQIFVKFGDQHFSLYPFGQLLKIYQTQGPRTFSQLWKESAGEPCPNWIFNMIQAQSEHE